MGDVAVRWTGANVEGKVQDLCNVVWRFQSEIRFIAVLKLHWDVFGYFERHLIGLTCRETETPVSFVPVWKPPLDGLFSVTARDLALSVFCLYTNACLTGYSAAVLTTETEATALRRTAVFVSLYTARLVHSNRRAVAASIRQDKMTDSTHVLTIAGTRDRRTTTEVWCRAAVKSTLHAVVTFYYTILEMDIQTTLTGNQSIYHLRFWLVYQ